MIHVYCSLCCLYCLVNILHGLHCTFLCSIPAETNGRGVGSPDKVYSDLNALEQWQHTIEQAEQHWGPSHPAVGRAWLELARALQAADKDSEKARHATKKAFDICQILLKQTAMVSNRSEHP